MNMRQRFFKRKDLHLKANVTVGHETYDGYIEDVSEAGMGYLITSSMKASEEFVPDKSVHIKFDFPYGGSVQLHCIIVWVSDKLFEEDKLVTGMKIIDPPQEYRDWVETLHLDVVD